MVRGIRVAALFGLWIATTGMGLGSSWDASEVEGELFSRTLYLIRHGQYDHDDDRDPDVGKALIPLGVTQARLLSARLQGMPVDFSALHSSTMTRARETARVIGDDLGLVLKTSRSLRECTPPTWRKDIMEEESEEDLALCKLQIDEAFAKYFTPATGTESHELIVGHGNVIRSFVTRALKVDPDTWLGMSIGNCSLTIIHVRADGAMKVLSYSDVGHIPPNLQTRTSPGQLRDLRVPSTPDS